MRLIQPASPLETRARAAAKLVAATLFAVSLLANARAFAQTCPFDDGNSTLANDGLVLTRYALGIRGAAMLANTDFVAGDAATIESNIACPACGLRITDDRDGLNNPIFTATDATIISRKLAGLSGDALTNGLALGSGTRNTPAAVNSFLLAGCGATGGTVTSVTAGQGLTVLPNVIGGGSITSTGTIQLALGGVIEGHIAANAVTAAKLADESVTNAKIALGSVTNSKLGTGSVSTSKLADASVDGTKLTSGSVSQIKLSEVSSPSAAGQLLSTTGPNPGGSLTWVNPPTLSCVNSTSSGIAVAAGDQQCATEACPAGYTASGGGMSSLSLSGVSAFNTLVYSSLASGNGWRVCLLAGGSSGSVTYTITARCCKVD
jgi:hypothetical protein